MGGRLLVRRGERKRAKSPLGSLIELVGIVAVAVGLALGIQAVLVKPFRIPSESMYPTLKIGQRVLVDRLDAHLGRDYHRGDVLVFTPPAGAEREQCQAPTVPGRACPKGTAARSHTNFIKRVVGVGGDHIAIRGGHVYLDGERQHEPFADLEFCAGGECDLPREITVPKGQLFMMGDNRGESADSRIWGPVPERWVVGKAFATYWPPGRVGTL
jgi:signal peptidase I